MANPAFEDERDENARFRELVVDVSETQELMKDNIHKTIVRGFKLQELENRSGKRIQTIEARQLIR